MKLQALLALAIVAAVLAGCSNPPTGSLTTVGGLKGVEGKVIASYQAAKNPVNDTTMGVVKDCAPAQAPPNLQCTPASTAITVRLDAAPDPGTQAYHAYLMPVTGPGRDLGELAENGTGYSLTFKDTSDLSPNADRVEVRHGEFVLALASAKGPTNEIAIATNNTLIEATGTYTGPDLNLKVSGLPASGTYTVRLYIEKDGAYVSQEEFPIANGETTIHATKDIATFKQVHIHVAGTAINLLTMETGA